MVVDRLYSRRVPDVGRFVGFIGVIESGGVVCSVRIVSSSFGCESRRRDQEGDER